MARRKADLAAASLTGGSGSGSGSSAVVGAKISVEGPLTEEEIKQVSEWSERSEWSICVRHVSHPVYAWSTRQ